MHLDSLKIQNFRILEDIEVKKLGHVNLIVGKNNSGKSTVLEALALLASGFAPETLQRLITNREVTRYESKNNSKANFQNLSFDNLFCNNTKENLLDLKACIGNANYFINFELGNLFKYNNNIILDDTFNHYYIKGLWVTSKSNLKHLEELNHTTHYPIFHHEYIDTHATNTSQLAEE